LDRRHQQEWHAQGPQQSTPTMHSDAGSPQTNGIWILIIMREIQKKSQRDQSDLVTTKDKVQRATVCSNTHTSCTQPSSNKRTDIYFKS
jgi:hypothetical protein